MRLLGSLTPARPARPARAARLGRGYGPLVMVGAVLIAICVLVALLAPLIAPADPLAQKGVPLTGPSGEFLLGTDSVGRDVLSRILHGARISVFGAVAMVAGACLLGTTVGLVAGFFGGRLDELLMRLVDLFFAFPVIILAMAIAASLGASLSSAIFAGLLVTWPAYARTVRGLTISLREADFVHAARLAGVAPWRFILRDLAPAIAGPVLVLATNEIATAILLLAGLSFLGLGAQPPTAEWGAMISEGTQYFTQWWISVFPGAAVLLVALAFNLVGDGLRDRFDRRLAGHRTGGVA